MFRFSAFLAGVCALLALAVPTLAQSIPAKGADATLDVATWNVEWFGSPSNGPSDDARQLAHVRAVIQDSAIDVWALQEIDDVKAFNELLAALGPDYGGIIRDNTLTSVSQRLAFIYRKNVVAVRRIEQLFVGQYDREFAYRPPLLVEAAITLPDTTVTVTLVTVHMKASGDQDSYDRRTEASQRLKNRLDFLYPSTPIVLLGDLNDELGRSISGGKTSPYDNFLQHTTAYRILTLPLDQGRIPTFCGSSFSCASGSTLDHIIITDELFGAYVDGSANRYAELLDAFDGTGGACSGEFVCTTSDHLPVYARFRFASNVAVEGAETPVRFGLAGASPNPFGATTTLRFTLDRPGPVRLDVYDLLGRRVAVPVDALLGAGPHQAAFDASSLPPGLYLARLQAAGRVAVQRLVKM